MFCAEGGSAFELIASVMSVSKCFKWTIFITPVKPLQFGFVSGDVLQFHIIIVHGYKVSDFFRERKQKNHFFSFFLFLCFLKTRYVSHWLPSTYDLGGGRRGPKSLIFNDLRHEILNLILKSQTLFLFFFETLGILSQPARASQAFSQKTYFYFFWFRGCNHLSF